MTYFVGENCIKCKYTDCVVSCPVDCFVEGPNFLVIDPGGCIDCGVCVPECPAEAIFADTDDVPDREHWLLKNAELAQIWEPIYKKKDPLPDADQWNGVPGKRDMLEE